MQVTFKETELSKLEDAVLRAFDAGAYYIFVKVFAEDVETFEAFAKEAGLDARISVDLDGRRIYQTFF